jgi:hypothetical protein
LRLLKTIHHILITTTSRARECSTSARGSYGLDLPGELAKRDSELKIRDEQQLN